MSANIQIVGIEEVELAPHETKTISSQSVGEAPFGSAKMMVWESVIGGTTIKALLVNDEPQAGLSKDADGVKSVFFANTTIGNGFRFRCAGEEKVALVMRNDTDEIVKVAAAFFGGPDESGSVRHKVV